MTAFLWADCHTHGPHKSTHLYSYSAIGLVDENNAIWALLTLQKDKLQGSSATGPNDVKLVGTSKRQVADKLKTCSSLMDKPVTWTPLFQ